MTRLRVMTNSERSTRACLRRWGFRYLDGLTTSDSAAPLRQGSLVHQILAAHYRHLRDFGAIPPNPVAFASAIIDPWLEQRRAWLATITDEWARAAEVEDVDMAVQSREMYLGHYGRWGFEEHAHWEVLLVEESIARYVRDEDGRPLSDVAVMPDGSVEARQWVAGGAIDVVIRDKRTDMVWLVEHKTTSDKDFEAYVAKLHWDPQIRIYPWILLDPIGRDPLPIVGVIYNVLRKATPKIPEQTKVKGNRTSRVPIDTTPELFVETLRARGEDPDDFADVIEKLHGRWYHARREYVLTPPELADFEVDFRAEVRRAIDDSRPGVYLPRQTAVCQSVAAYRCPYAEPCIEDGPDVRRNYQVMTIRHAELEGDLAEPGAARERGLTLASPGKRSVLGDDLAEAFRTQQRDRDKPVDDTFNDLF